MRVQTNIWRIFYVLLVVGTFILFLLLNTAFTSIKYRHDTQLEHYAEMIKTSISSTFEQKELLLDILGNQLIENDNYKNKKNSIKILDNLLKKSKYIIAFGLVDTDGNLLVSSSNIKLPKSINILKSKNSTSTFKKAIYSDTMIIGRTIFFKPLNKWIIPIRKSIRDENGKVLAVMTAGIINEKNTNYLDGLKISSDYGVGIVQDYDENHNMYRQYDSNAEINSDLLYNNFISEKIIDAVRDDIYESYDMTLDDLRRSEKSVSYHAITTFGDKKVVGIAYDKTYSLWVLVKSSMSVVLDTFIKIASIYIILYIFGFITIYWLFKKLTTADLYRKRELIYQAQHDSLTSLPNRTYMYEHIDTWIQNHQNKYDVLYIDLDNFKNINDKFGHTIGDEILIEVAKRLSSFFNSDDMLIRQGADEFIVLKECLDESKIESNFLKLINRISEVYYIENKEYRIGMSVGIAQFPHDAKTLEELLSLADTAMYEAKKVKNSYCFFSEKLRHVAAMKTDIEQELRGAIKRDELWMVYQPQINEDGSVYGVEALVRWENKKLGFVGPDKFISVAEETGLMRELGEFIIKRALKEINIIKKEINQSFSLSINISVIQLMEADFLAYILKLIDDEKFNKFELTLEITESLSIEDLDEVIPILHAIRKEGIEISLDDFGTGYSSLSVLKKLPINELKIDKSFIDEILYDESEKVLVQSIINIGKNFGMKTLAEGVENFEQVKELKSYNCDIFQGYFYSKPLIKEDLITFINTAHKDAKI